MRSIALLSWLSLQMFVCAASAGAGESTDCVPGEKDAALCTTHAAIEKERLPILRADLRNKKEATERITALRAIAALTTEHSNAPSRLVADTLADGMKDKELQVIAEAARLLSTGESHAPAVCKTVLRFGTRRAVKLAAQAIEEYAEAIKDQKRSLELEKDFEEMCKSAPAEIKMPPTKGAFTEKLSPYGEHVYDSLARFAAAKGLGELPPWNVEQFETHVIKWLARHEARLPVDVSDGK